MIMYTHWFSHHLSLCKACMTNMSVAHVSSNHMHLVFLPKLSVMCHGDGSPSYVAILVSLECNRWQETEYFGYGISTILTQPTYIVYNIFDCFALQC